MNKNALKIIQTLTDNNFQAVFAGGCVRDFLLKTEPKDFDIATNATPDQIESIFPKTLAIGKAFGVILVLIDDEQFEVATFRSDGYSSDGRHPDSVSFVSLEEDARRRDITINGMFYNPLTNDLIDVVNGRADLEQKIVRFIGDPIKRIEEDKLRLLRVIRFAARLDFEIEPMTWSAVQTYAHLINEVSVERISEELTKLLSVKNKERALDLLSDSNLLGDILPEVKKMQGCEQPVDFHPEGDVWVHVKKTLSNLPEDASPELLWAVFLHDVGKPLTQTFEERIRFDGHDVKGAEITEEILKRLKFSNEFIEHTQSLVRNHMKFMHVQDMRKSRLKRFMGLAKFHEHMLLHKADCMSSHEDLDNFRFLVEKQKTFEEESEVMVSKLPKLVDGHDLIKLGFKQGPEFKTILIDIEDQQLEGTINDKESALNYVIEKYKMA